ncbi:MAG: hypothetical protein L0Y35_08740 [Flammeovirgaceae bacterium]|nr:hypothetical protein [Flammeovirgaceae bacterium]
MEAIKKFHLPPPDSFVNVEYAPEAYYNSLQEHVIYKTYPVYLKEFERPGYLDSLRTLEPEIAFDPQKLKTQEDWVKAGELVFHFPVASYRPINGKVSHLEESQFEKGAGKFTADGIYPFNRYIINEKGKLIIGSHSCASCHTRVMDSGVTITGAQGNVYNPTGFVKNIQSGSIPFAFLQQGVKQLAYAPWAPETFRSIPSDKEELVSSLLELPGGVADRQGYAFLYPLAVPSLIGLKDIKYLDNTGLMRHDGPADLMRYAAFNQGMDMLTRYNNYIPLGKKDNAELPPPAEWNHPFGYVGKRYTDAQLYALTQYIYALKPPENPNQFPKELIAKGKLVFNKAGCITCHTPPLYTNNKLTPVNGFEPPADHFKKYDIFNVSVETDSVSALYSRRATGYYKVPSLRGLWYRGAFFHNGNLTTLDEVLDPKRLQPDYIPSGFKPPHLKTMAVKGHPFGLDLSEKDKKALIAFLKTL